MATNSEAVLSERVRELCLEQIIPGLQARMAQSRRHRLLEDLRAHSALGRPAHAAVH